MQNVASTTFVNAHGGECETQCSAWSHLSTCASEHHGDLYLVACHAALEWLEGLGNINKLQDLHDAFA